MDVAWIEHPGPRLQKECQKALPQGSGSKKAERNTHHEKATTIALALAMILLAAVLAGCSSAKAASEKVVLTHKDAAAPSETEQIVLSLGDGWSADLGAVSAGRTAGANTAC